MYKYLFTIWSIKKWLNRKLITLVHCIFLIGFICLLFSLLHRPIIKALIYLLSYYFLCDVLCNHGEIRLTIVTGSMFYEQRRSRFSFVIGEERHNYNRALVHHCKRCLLLSWKVNCFIYHKKELASSWMR